MLAHFLSPTEKTLDKLLRVIANKRSVTCHSNTVRDLKITPCQYHHCHVCQRKAFSVLSNELWNPIPLPTPVTYLTLYPVVKTY